MAKGKKVSLWWMFVPIFLGALGGLAVWRMHKEREREFALIMLVVGIAFTLVIVPFYVWLLLTYL
jgi:NADH:ubiquinone oxidoreductase subunit 2 (subunit N)